MVVPQVPMVLKTKIVICIIHDDWMMTGGANHDLGNPKLKRLVT